MSILQNIKGIYRNAKFGGMHTAESLSMASGRILAPPPCCVCVPYESRRSNRISVFSRRSRRKRWEESAGFLTAKGGIQFRMTQGPKRGVDRDKRRKQEETKEESLTVDAELSIVPPRKKNPSSSHGFHFVCSAQTQKWISSFLRWLYARKLAPHIVTCETWQEALQLKDEADADERSECRD